MIESEHKGCSLPLAKGVHCMMESELKAKYVVYEYGKTLNSYKIKYQ
jgi:hypothetical protein